LNTISEKNTRHPMEIKKQHLC